MGKLGHLFVPAQALLLAVVVGCSTSPPALPGSSSQKSNLTPGMVKKTVVRGSTTQTQVLQTFGAPNIVTMDQSGREVWTYDVQSVSRSEATTARGGGAGAGAGGVTGSTVIGGAAGVGGGKSTSAGQVSSSTFTLMITFDEAGVVSDYRMLSTQF